MTQQTACKKGHICENIKQNAQNKHGTKNAYSLQRIFDILARKQSGQQAGNRAARCPWQRIRAAFELQWQARRARQRANKARRI
jgi:hypothetical protein